MEKRSHKSVLDMIDNLLEQADHVKQASNLDLASDAKSTHPSANVDDKTKPATEGSRSAENKSDVQKQVPDNVEEAGSKNTPGDSENAADTMGTQSMDADAMKGNVETPKKDHSQSMADKGPGDGKETFKGDWDKASADQLVAGANSLLEQLSSSLGVKSAKEIEIEMERGKKPKVEVEDEDEGEDEKEEEGKKASDDVAGMYKAAAEKYPDDEEAGYVAASMLLDFLTDEKSASDQYAETVDGIQKQAANDADSYVSFLRGYEESVKEAQPMMAADPSVAAGPEAAMGGAGGGEEMGDEAALAALAEAAGGAGGEEGGEGGPDDEAIIEAIAEALDEAGVTPEELAEAVAEAEGEAPVEGEAPPEGGEDLEAMSAEEAPPEEPKMAANKAKKGQVKKAASKDALRAAVQKIVRG